MNTNDQNSDAQVATTPTGLGRKLGVPGKSTEEPKEVRADCIVWPDWLLKKFQIKVLPC